jgi:hypothetical protein
MRSMSRSCTTAIQDLARHRLGPAVFVAMVSPLSACIVPPAPWTPGDGQLIAPRDSAALAHETGHRDARVLQRPRSAAGATKLITTFAVEVGLFIRRPGTNFWVTPVAIGSISAGGALWAYRETKRPLPAPPDSMRSRYGLSDERLWRSYGDGFREAIDDRRRAELALSSRSALMTAIVFGGTYAALRRR